ncbi:MAG: TetR/AcrR family transcriptional regulator [Candidatus Aminicenantes bacterium]|nr:TetR/AcrR family transcriptional regulator [Candidatus Aminicenantes bacterium]
MGYIVKEFDERLNEFLDTAQQLFFQKGYAKTSVNDIIKQMDVAKGTFYHYFKSKIDLLDRLVERFTRKAVLAAKELVHRENLNAVEKLNSFFAAIRDLKVENKELMIMLMKVMYTDENLIFRHKMFKRNIEALAPEFAKIIRQGVEEGCFDPVDDRETAEMIFTMAMNVNETVVALMLEMEKKPKNIDIIEAKLKAYEKAIERLLGAPQGSFSLVERRIIEIFRVDQKEQEKIKEEKK